MKGLKEIIKSYALHIFIGCGIILIIGTIALNYYKREKAHAEELQNKYQVDMQSQTQKQVVDDARQRDIEPEETVNTIGDKLPYEGMPEKYLSDTAMGIAYYYGANSVREKGGYKTADIYYYYSGDAIVFTARIVDGKVYDVNDYRAKPWVRPQTFKNHPYIDREVVGGKITEDIPDYSSYDSDPYDVNWYDDPDDFAADWEDDFDSYDDAYDYYEENHK